MVATRTSPRGSGCSVLLRRWGRSPGVCLQKLGLKPPIAVDKSCHFINEGIAISEGIAASANSVNLLAPFAFFSLCFLCLGSIKFEVYCHPHAPCYCQGN